MSLPSSEYLAANGHHISQIIAESQRLLDEYPRIHVVQLGIENSPTITEHPFSPDYFLDVYEGTIDKQTADRLSEIEVVNALTIAAGEILTTNTLNSMYYWGRVIQEQGPAVGEKSHILSYGAAEYIKAFISSSGNIEYTRLTDVEATGSADKLTVRREDIYTSTDVTILRSSEQVLDIDHKVSPLEDADFSRWLHLLGEVFPQHLLAVTAGRFDTEEDLDTTLQVVRQEFHGSSKEQEVSIALQEIKQRAVAAKESRTMSV
ncbi:MAG TPA: hypothetical protein VK983_05100 [Candidatus Limnocylindrales bacterium]|nr:hypothetical protein [Candidatus Limnocylindrales bacterium]